MPINRFSTVGQSEYTPQHVPLPFEAIGALGEKIQKTQDAAIDDTYKLKDLMTKVPAIYDPNLGLSNIEKKKELDAQFAPKIDELTNKIMAGDPNAPRELEQVKRDFANNPIRQELEESYFNYKTYKDDITKKGGKYDRLLDDYYGQQLIGESGELKPFRYSGMEDSLDAPKRFKEVMGDIAEDAKSWDIESLGADGIKIGSKGKRAGVDEAKVNKVVNNKVNLALNTDEGKQFVKRLRRLKPDITNEELINETRKALFSSAYEQIGSEQESGSSVDPTMIWSKLYDKKEEKEAYDRLPMHELPIQTPGEITNKDALNVFNLGAPVNADGSISFGTKLTTTKGGIVTKKETVSKENLVSFYTGLQNTAKNLGVPIPKLSNGKTDYNKLQTIVTEVGKNMLINGQVGQGLQTELSNNMSSYYLGTIGTDDEFKKSPFLESAKITETGSPSNKVVDEDQKNQIASNGVIKDINFYAEQPGTFVITTNDKEGKSKNYDIYLGEKVSKALTQPTWSLTKSFENNIKGKISKEEYKDIEASENIISKQLQTQYEAISNPKLKQYLLNNLSETLSETENMKTTSVINSAERLENGSPKYVFVGKQGIDLQTNKPIEKVIVINKSNGNIELKDLNEVQALESSYIQQQISRGYKPKLSKDER